MKSLVRTSPVQLKGGWRKAGGPWGGVHACRKSGMEGDVGSPAAVGVLTVEQHHYYRGRGLAGCSPSSEYIWDLLLPLNCLCETSSPVFFLSSMSTPHPSPVLVPKKANLFRLHPLAPALRGVRVSSGSGKCLREMWRLVTWVGCRASAPLPSPFLPFAWLGPGAITTCSWGAALSCCFSDSGPCF